MRKKHNDQDLSSKMEGYEEKLQHKLQISEINRKQKLDEMLRKHAADGSLEMEEDANSEIMSRLNKNN